jgi:hypothetical protein
MSASDIHNPITSCGSCLETRIHIFEVHCTVGVAHQSSVSAWCVLAQSWIPAAMLLSTAVLPISARHLQVMIKQLRKLLVLGSAVLVHGMLRSNSCKCAHMSCCCCCGDA